MVLTAYYVHSITMSKKENLDLAIEENLLQKVRETVTGNSEKTQRRSSGYFLFLCAVAGR